MGPRHDVPAHKSVDSLKHRAYLNTMTHPDHTLDALGLLCPLPVLKARKRLSVMGSGEVLHMIADDPAAVIDVPHFCAEAGHTLLEQTDDNGVLSFNIRRK